MINSFAPALIAPLLAHLETFSAMLPALWLFGAAPAPLALSPSVGGAVAWVVITGVAESVWSPRSNGHGT